MYMDRDLIAEEKLYQIIDQFIERKITTVKFYSILLNEIHSVRMQMLEHVRYCLLKMTM